MTFTRDWRGRLRLPPWAHDGGSNVQQKAGHYITSKAVVNLHACRPFNASWVLA
jgi:hypothetical protein